MQADEKGWRGLEVNNCEISGCIVFGNIRATQPGERWHRLGEKTFGLTGNPFTGDLDR
jgi:hypothetical protein